MLVDALREFARYKRMVWKETAISFLLYHKIDSYTWKMPINDCFGIVKKAEICKSQEEIWSAPRRASPRKAGMKAGMKFVDQYYGK